jgi:hypothetical protein
MSRAGDGPARFSASKFEAFEFDVRPRATLKPRMPKMRVMSRMVCVIGCRQPRR